MIRPVRIPQIYALLCFLRLRLFQRLLCLATFPSPRQHKTVTHARYHLQIMQTFVNLHGVLLGKILLQPQITSIRSTSAVTGHNEVWIHMDNTTSTRWKGYAANVPKTCADVLRLYFCLLYFSPCDDTGNAFDPVPTVLMPVCQQVLQFCPPSFKRICQFSPYTPPDPQGCSNITLAN